MSQSEPEIELDSNVEEARIADAGAEFTGWLVVAACVHVMYACFIVYGSKPRTAAVLATLTIGGRKSYLPERELPVYVLGCGLALALSVLAALFWRRTAIGRERTDPGFTLRGCLFTLIVAALASGFNLSWLLAVSTVAKSLTLPRPIEALVMILPAAAEIALFCAGYSKKGSLRALLIQFQTELKPIADRIVETGRDAAGTVRAPNKGPAPWRLLLDIAVMLFTCAVIYIPRTDLLAGRDYTFQHFHHWDFFAMGPAIGLLTGRHLATQVYAQYGFGWPLLMTKLNPVFALSYGHAYKIAVIDGCLYYCGLYLLLRRLLTNPAFAIAGLMLALRLQVFHSAGADIPLWCIPATSVLRTPCDVWVLLLLTQHWRSQRPLPLLIAGVLVGLSVLFVIDMGVYLTIAFAVYIAVWILSPAKFVRAGGKSREVPIRSKRSRCVVSIGAFALAGIALFSGLMAASGFDVFSAGYLHYWMEVLWLYPSGIMMLPMVQEITGLIFSYWFVLLFLAHISAAAIRLWNRQAVDPVVPCIAVLGALYLIYYIGNSHAYSMFQLSTPFCIVAACTVERATTALFGRSPGLAPALERNVAVYAALAITVLVVLNPQFHSYPNLVNTLLKPPPREVTCYFPDLQDACIAASHSTDVETFQRVASEMRELTRQGKTIAVITNDDTSLYVASRAPLWNRYTPLLPPLVTQSMLAEMNRDLSTKPVDYVFLRSTDPSNDGYWTGTYPLITTDSWKTLGDTTRLLYRFDHTCGPFAVYRR